MVNLEQKTKVSWLPSQLVPAVKGLNRSFRAVWKRLVLRSIIETIPSANNSPGQIDEAARASYLLKDTEIPINEVLFRDWRNRTEIQICNCGHSNSNFAALSNLFMPTFVYGFKVSYFVKFMDESKRAGSHRPAVN